MAKRRVTKRKSAPETKAKTAKARGVKRTAKHEVLSRGRAASAATVLTHERSEAGFATGRYGILVPDAIATNQVPKKPIAPSKLAKGLVELMEELDSLAADDLFTTSKSFEVQEVSLTASFSAEGRFVGFGIGGATSISLTLGPRRK